MAVEQHTDRYLPPGTKVRLDNLWNGVTPGSEFGVVVHCWANEELGGHHDCLVAFFGNRPPPSGQPDDQPYILRYAATSLSPLNDWPA